MNTVKDLLNINKNKELYWVSPYDTVATAIQKMSRHNLGAILVIHKNEVVGIFSEQDYTRKICLQGKAPQNTNIYEVMVPKIIYASSDYLLEECLAVMTQNHIRHLPIIDYGKILALLSIEEIVKAVLDDKEFIIDQLTKYVAGSPFVANKSECEARKKLVRELILDQREKYEKILSLA